MTSYVIVGDPDRSRFELLSERIKSNFQFEVLWARTFDHVMAEYRERYQEVKLILLTDGISESTMLPNHFETIRHSSLIINAKAAALEGYVHGKVPAEFPRPHEEPRLFLPFPANEKTSADFLERMRGAFFSSLLPAVSLDKKDALLREQVRSLDHKYDLESGKTKLGRIIGGFFAGGVTVYRLKAGFSGATVFRLEVSGGSGQYILKLDRESWKLQAEAGQHTQVPAGIPRFRQSKTNLVAPRGSAPAQNGVVGTDGWFGICYDLVGDGPFGPVLDLERALTVPVELLGIPADTTLPANGSADKFRTWILRSLLEWLKKTWCTRQGLVTRSLSRWWDPSDGPVDSYETFPPYRLPARSKGWVLGFLESSDAAIGARLIPDYWESLSKIVKSFVLCDPKTFGLSGLDHEISMVRSPAHGDLNSNNVLFCLELADPIFLIDFPMYQHNGHALQDFARLEAEVKFALMDRQEEPGLPGLDYTPGQFALWSELETHLSEAWEKPRIWKSDGLPNNVQLTLQLIQSIRSAAREVQAQPTPGSPCSTPFLVEYNAALLFHTLRAITFPSLSPFKRVLAVFSAAGLLKQLGFAAADSVTLRAEDLNESVPSPS